MHPTNTMPNYYREGFSTYSTASLLLTLDLPQLQKEALLMRLVQLGIDQFATILNGDGDRFIGRGLIVFTAILLNDDSMAVFDYPYREAYRTGTARSAMQT